MQNAELKKEYKICRGGFNIRPILFIDCSRAFNERPYNLDIDIIKLVERLFLHGYSTNYTLILIFRKFFVLLFSKK